MRKTPNRQGMTIIEASIAMLVMSIVMAGSYALIIRSARLTRTARNHYLAINICKNHIERARGFQYQELPSLALDNEKIDEFGNRDEVNGLFLRSTSVTTNWNFNTNVTEVVVTVRVPTLSSDTNTVEGETLKMLFTPYYEPEE